MSEFICKYPATFYRIYHGKDLLCEDLVCTSMCNNEKAAAFMANLEEENTPYYAEAFSMRQGKYKPFKQFKGR